MQTLSVIRTWRTKVDVCVITDNQRALQLVLDRWTCTGVRICPYSTPLVQEEKYSLLVSGTHHTRSYHSWLSLISSLLCEYSY